MKDGKKWDYYIGKNRLGYFIFREMETNGTKYRQYLNRDDKWSLSMENHKVIFVEDDARGALVIARIKGAKEALQNG